MNDLQEKKVLTLDSREVADMVEKRHADLLRDIEVYLGYLGQNADLRSDEFFLESSYQAGTGKEYKCYLITKKGCEFIAHKLTGLKGAIFTATYINRFHQLEESLEQAITMLTEEQKLQLAIFQARTVEEAGIAAANLDRYRRNQLEDKQKALDHKTEVIKGVTDDIDIYAKRNVLNKVVRYKNANFSERWNELYDRYKEVHSVDLRARCEGYNLKQKRSKDKLSVVKYAEKFGHIDNLYKIALKLYETDINEILGHLREIA